MGMQQDHLDQMKERTARSRISFNAKTQTYELHRKVMGRWVIDRTGLTGWQALEIYLGRAVVR